MPAGSTTTIDSSIRSTSAASIAWVRSLRTRSVTSWRMTTSSPGAERMIRVSIVVTPPGDGTS